MSEGNMLGGEMSGSRVEYRRSHRRSSDPVNRPAGHVIRPAGFIYRAVYGCCKRTALLYITITGSGLLPDTKPRCEYGHRGVVHTALEKSLKVLDSTFENSRSSILLKAAIEVVGISGRVVNLCGRDFKNCV